MEHIAMNREERDRLEWLKRAQDEVITQGQAAERMGASDRWVRQRLVRMGTWDDGVVVHGLRGRAPRPSNRRAGGCLCGLPEQGGLSFQVGGGEQRSGSRGARCRSPAPLHLATGCSYQIVVGEGFGAPSAARLMAESAAAAGAI